MLRFSWVPPRARQCENHGEQAAPAFGAAARHQRQHGCEPDAKGRGEHAISMTDGTRSQAWLFWLGLGLSLAIHIGVTVHLLSRAVDDFGTINIPTPAISVNIEATDVLDALEQSESIAANNAPASPPGEMTPTPDPEPEPEPQKTEAPPPPAEPEKVEAPPPPQPDHEKLAAEQRAAEEKAQEEAKARDEEALQQAAAAERERQDAEQRDREKARQLAEDRARAEREAEKREAERREEERERRAEKAEQAEREAKRKRVRLGANAGASGSQGAKSSAGRVSASQGDLLRYKGTLNNWIASRKPPSVGKRGYVVVTFAVSPSGSLISARISSSSGDKALDQLALAAMRGAAPFPKPPSGLTTTERLFTFKYSFLR